jgi:hypothetical protein
VGEEEWKEITIGRKEGRSKEWMKKGEYYEEGKEGWN